MPQRSRALARVMPPFRARPMLQDPFDPEAIRQSLKKQGIAEMRTVAMPEAVQREYTAEGPQIVLTDAYAPVDNLMAVTFLNRNK